MTLSPHLHPSWLSRAWLVRIPHWLGALLLAALWLVFFYIALTTDDERGMPQGGGYIPETREYLEGGR